MLSTVLICEASACLDCCVIIGAIATQGWLRKVLCRLTRQYSLPFAWPNLLMIRISKVRSGDAMHAVQWGTSEMFDLAYQLEFCMASGCGQQFPLKRVLDIETVFSWA